MSESETNEITDQEMKHGNSPKKRIRHRKKQIYENILKQMEFYFSDANLTKDRYLAGVVNNDPYVSLEIFLKFNKIRAMTQDVHDIAKAMKHSTLLELSEDRSKVKRKTPVQQYDADLRTVYVESIPVTASREWLQRVFSEYGQIAYISLPKFKNSQKIKGYGFIEFNKPEDAQKCLNRFIKMGCKLPTCMPPEELSSIKLFSVEEPHDEATDDVQNKPEKKHEQECEPPKKKKKNKDKKGKNLELKLERESDSEKRMDTPTPTTPSDENKSIAATPTDDENKSIAATPTDENKHSEAEAHTESKDEMTSQDEGKGESTRKKKTRKRTAKERNKAKRSLGPNDASKGALWGLQVLSKPEWKALRNKYLNLQRKYMKEIKNTIREQRRAYTAIPEPAASVEAEEAIDAQESGDDKAVEPLEEIPGVFVEEVLPEPCTDVRLTKRTIRSNIHVLHVEAKEGQQEIVIRFDSADAASEYCAAAGADGRRACVLTGAAAAAQWARAAAARSHKRARGRARLLRKHAPPPAAPACHAVPAHPQPTHTHICFDDERE